MTPAERKAVAETLDHFEQTARFLGRIEARKEFGCYTQDDAITECVFYESLRKDRLLLAAAMVEAGDSV
jgi:hypothetical protein